jgi:hypothetical protein
VRPADEHTRGVHHNPHRRVRVRLSDVERCVFCLVPLARSGVSHLVVVPYIVELPRSSSSDGSSSDEELVVMHDDEPTVPELDSEEAIICRFLFR